VNRGSKGFPEDGFDLNEFRRKAIAHKRENFWKRKAWQFSLISTLSMLILFGTAYFLYGSIASFLADIFNLR